MTERIIRTQNQAKDGFRVLQGEKEYVTYLGDSCFRLWYSDIPWRYEPHYHSAVEIVLTLKGTVEYEAEGKHYTVRENEILVVPPEISHSLNMEEGSSRYLILFEPEALYGLQDVKGLTDAFHRVFYLDRDNPALEEARALLMEAVKAYEEGEPLWNTLCYSYMMKVYVLLAKHCLTDRIHARRDDEKRTDAGIITGSVVYINNHYQEELTLDQVADFAGFSRFYFSRSFKKQTGYSFKDYLCQKRLQVATDLLIRTEKGMREVARESGFGSVATFNRVFREHKNCTPTQYRSIYGLR